VAVALFVVGMIIILPGGASRRALEQTRRELRQQGFKINHSEFNVVIAPETRARMITLTDVPIFHPSSHDRDDPQPFFPGPDPAFIATVTSDAAMVYWNTTKVPGTSGRIWQRFRKATWEHRDFLNAASAAASSGPIQFDFAPTEVESAILRHLSVIKWLGMIFPARATLELHGGNPDEAWTNLLAATRLISAWRVEPTEMSHLTRRLCAINAYDATWQLLQTNAWTDEQLRLLQDEWEKLDYLSELPDTIAFARASMAAEFQSLRQSPIRFGLSVGGVFRSPAGAWRALVDCWRRLRYRQDGSYEDEGRFLEYSCARERELREAVKSRDWLAMCSLPGVTNFVPFAISNSRLSARTQQSIAKLGLRVQADSQSLVVRAVDSEARRRVLVTAIALERYRNKHGAYPEALSELSSTFLKYPLADFIDGRSLRYRRTSDGHFVLWSIGLDSIDNGGLLTRKSKRVDPLRFEALQISQPTEHTDLVWPRPATEAEIDAALSAQPATEL